MLNAKPTVGLFVTCLVDAMRPSIGFASIKLLEDAGCTVEVPRAQTCCGQPGFNSGADDIARGIVKQIIETFEQFDYVVVPSGSCAGMIKVHARELFEADPAWLLRQEALAAKTFEIMSFLTDVMQYRPSTVSYAGVVTYHDSCSGLRDLGVHDQPRALLGDVAELKMVPLDGDDA